MGIVPEEWKNEYIVQYAIYKVKGDKEDIMVRVNKSKCLESERKKCLESWTGLITWDL